MSLPSGYFAGERNINSGQRDEGSPTLRELLNAGLFGIGRTLHVEVDPTVTLFNPDGSKGLPFRQDQIQDAIDKAGTELSSSRFSTVTISLGPGLFDLGDEELVNKYDGINFVGSSLLSTEIKSTGTPLAITNATLSSLADFRISGDYSDLLYDADINDGAGPQQCIVENLTLRSTTSGKHALGMYGVKGDASATTTSFGWDNINFVGGILLNKVSCIAAATPNIYGRNIGVYDFQGVVAGVGQQFYNCYYGGWSWGGQGAEIECHQDTSDPNGYHAQGHLYYDVYHSQMHDVDLYGDVVISARMSEIDDLWARGTCDVTLFGCTLGQSAIDPLDIDDTATVTTYGGNVQGNINVEGGGSIEFNGTPIHGSLTLETGAGTAVVNGGPILGAIVDPDGKLTHDQGNITPLDGYCVRMTNDTGVASVKGTLVDASGSVTRGFVVADADSDDCIGVVYDDGIADGGICRVVVAGIAQVLLKNSTSATAGYWAKTSDVAGRADITTAAPPGLVAGHLQEIGHGVEDVTGGTDELAQVNVHWL